VFFGRVSSDFARVTLIDKGDLNRLAGLLLHAFLKF
jgi:hypothetical protein